MNDWPTDVLLINSRTPAEPALLGAHVYVPPTLEHGYEELRISSRVENCSRSIRTEVLISSFSYHQDAFQELFIQNEVSDPLVLPSNTRPVR